MAIARQLKAIATTQIRNVAAIGSNIVVANANSDLTSALLATRTTVRLRSASATRELPLENFLVDTYRVALNADEILDAIRTLYLSLSLSPICTHYSPPCNQTFHLRESTNSSRRTRSLVVQPRVHRS